MLGYIGRVDNQGGFQRLVWVHAEHQAVTLIIQLHQAAWRVDAHYPDKGLQRHRIEARAVLLEHQGDGLVRAQGITRVERVAQVVELVGDAHQAAQPADGRFA